MTTPDTLKEFQARQAKSDEAWRSAPRHIVDAATPASAAEAVPAHWRAVLDPEQVPHQPKTPLHVVGFREERAARSWIAEQADFNGWRYTLEPLFTAPPKVGISASEAAPSVQPEPPPQAAKDMDDADMDAVVTVVAEWNSGELGFHAFCDRIIAIAAPAQVAEAVPVAWQVRRTDGSPLAVWESCTKDLYDLTLATGRYSGYDNAPPCEVRALVVAKGGVGISASEAADPMNYKGMFEAAVSSLAEISAALGIEEEDAACANGNDLILEAIARKNEAIMAAVTRPAHGITATPGTGQDAREALTPIEVRDGIADHLADNMPFGKKYTLAEIEAMVRSVEIRGIGGKPDGYVTWKIDEGHGYWSNEVTPYRNPYARQRAVWYGKPIEIFIGQDTEGGGNA